VKYTGIYRFQVNGKTYYGRTDHHDEAGDSLLVRYNPANPEQNRDATGDIFVCGHRLRSLLVAEMDTRERKGNAAARRKLLSKIPKTPMSPDNSKQEEMRKDREFINEYITRMAAILRPAVHLIDFAENRFPRYRMKSMSRWTVLELTSNSSASFRQLG
jgi:hypothetical protein